MFTVWWHIILQVIGYLGYVLLHLGYLRIFKSIPRTSKNHSFWIGRFNSRDPKKPASLCFLRFGAPYTPTPSVSWLQISRFLRLSSFGSSHWVGMQMSMTRLNSITTPIFPTYNFAAFKPAPKRNKPSETSWFSGIGKNKCVVPINQPDQPCIPRPAITAAFIPSFNRSRACEAAGSFTACQDSWSGCAKSVVYKYETIKSTNTSEYMNCICMYVYIYIYILEIKIYVYIYRYVSKCRIQSGMFA